MTKDLTVGKPETVLWKFCLPLFGSVIFQQLYNLADSFVAGKIGGENALAAVGNSYEITLILIAFAFGCNIGGSVISARFFGAKNYKKVKTTIYTTLIASSVLCAVLMVTGLIFCNPLLELIDTPEDILHDSSAYLRIYLFGLPFVFLYNISEGIFASLGDSKTPFIFLASSSSANILLDIVFALTFSNIVVGVAWATFICQSVSCVLSLLFLFLKLRSLETDGKTEIFSWKILKNVASVAIPSMLQQSFVSFGNIVIQKVINGFGTGVVAGYSAAIKLNGLVINSVVTISNGISNFTSQNLGAGKPERVKKGFTAGLKLVFVLLIPFILLYVFAGRFLVSVFINEPTETSLSVGRQFLLIVSPFYFTVAAKIVSDGVMRGAKMMKEFVIATFTDLILRVVLSIILSKTPLGTTGIWLSWPIGWIISMTLSLVFSSRGEWNSKKQYNIVK